MNFNDLYVCPEHEITLLLLICYSIILKFVNQSSDWNIKILRISAYNFNVVLINILSSLI